MTDTPCAVLRFSHSSFVLLVRRFPYAVFYRVIGERVVRASSLNRQSPFTIRICAGVRHSAANSRGFATTITTPRARLVATLKRCGSYRTPGREIGRAHV